MDLHPFAEKIKNIAEKTSEKNISESKRKKIMKLCSNAFFKEMMSSTYSGITKKVFSDQHIASLLSIGKYFGKLLDEKEKQIFLEKLIDKIPYIFKFVVGEIDSKTGISENFFDISKILPEDLGYYGYIKKSQINFSVSRWFRYMVSGNIKMIKTYMAFGIDPLTKDLDANLITHILAKKQPDILIDLLPMLIEKCGISPNERNRYGETILSILGTEHIERFKELLPRFMKSSSGSIDISQQNGDMNKTILHIVAEHHPKYMKDILPWLVSEYSVIVNSKLTQKTLLHILAQHKPEYLKELLPWLVDNYGVDPHKNDKSLCNIMHILGQYHPEYLKELLPWLVDNYDFNVYSKAYYEEYSLPHIIADDHPELLPEILSWLIDKYNFDPNIRDGFGRNVLGIIADGRPDEAIDFLQRLVEEYGISLCLKDKDGCTTIHKLCKTDARILMENIPWIIEKSNENISESFNNKKVREIFQQYIDTECIPYIQRSINTISQHIGLSIGSKVALDIDFSVIVIDEINKTNIYIEQLEKLGIAPLIQDILEKWKKLCLDVKCLVKQQSQFNVYDDEYHMSKEILSDTEIF